MSTIETLDSLGKGTVYPIEGIATGDRAFWVADRSNDARAIADALTNAGISYRMEYSHVDNGTARKMERWHFVRQG